MSFGTVHNTPNFKCVSPLTGKYYTFKSLPNTKEYKLVQDAL